MQYYTSTTAIMLSPDYDYDDKEWYSYKYLESAKHKCIRGSSRGIMKFLDKKGLIQGDHYIFIKHTREGIEYSNAYSKKYGEILFEASWVNGFVNATRKYKPLPDLLELAKHEMFQDSEGNLYEAEVRGERHYKKCFFKASDVARIFEIPQLPKTITRPDSAYREGVDYVFFNNVPGGNPTGCTITTYLTYYGLVRAITVSRSGIADTFMDWMMETLFAAQFGTMKQKSKAASKITGIDYPTVLAFCSTLRSKISAIYLFQIGTVGTLRDKLNIPSEYPDEEPVFKYGKTDDIKRRFKNHIDANYSEEKGYDCKLITMWFISKERLSDAEYSLKKHLIDNGWKLDNPKHTEIAIFDFSERVRRKGMKRRDFYKACIVEEIDPVFSEYATELQALEKRITLLTNENAMLRKDLAIKEYEIETLKSMLREKELELKLVEAEHKLSRIRL